MKDSEHLVRKFVAGLSGCKDFPVPVPATNLDDGIISLYLLFESQSESLTPSKLGDKTMVGCVCTASLSLYNAYVFGYCISQSSCQWKLNLRYIGDEHAKVFKRGIVTRGPGEAKITEIH